MPHFFSYINPLAVFRLRKDWRYLKYAFRARHADPDEREELAEKKGVRWSALDALPAWLPARNSPLEFMHATFLGLTLSHFRLYTLTVYRRGSSCHARDYCTWRDAYRSKPNK